MQLGLGEGGGRQVLTDRLAGNVTAKLPLFHLRCCPFFSPYI